MEALPHPARRLSISSSARDMRMLRFMSQSEDGKMKKQEDRLKVRDLIRQLENDGWRLARTRGSHRQFKHPSKPGTVTVAGQAGIDVPVGTLDAILKQAGLKK
jgi:predicted RNA binding protein YcfA (HicA-like mRNA interferase family)